MIWRDDDYTKCVSLRRRTSRCLYSRFFLCSLRRSLPGLPPVSAGVLEAELGRELVRLLRAAGAVHVGDRLRLDFEKKSVIRIGKLHCLKAMCYFHLLRLHLVQERGEDPPGLPELVRADKVHLGAQEHVKDQALIGVGKARALQEGKFKYLICACKKNYVRNYVKCRIGRNSFLQ